jgi:transketolase N-terminal domain/subunit
MKRITYETIKKLENDGWKIITLSACIFSKHHKAQGWYANLLKDGAYLYVEIEEEKTLGHTDTQLECPKCGRLYNEGEDDSFGECPDCEVAWDWKKEIPKDYI